MERKEELSRLIELVLSFIEGTREELPFETLALEIFRFQKKHNESYRKFCGHRDVSDWRHIPSVVTSAFKASDWTVLEPAERRRVFYSSGTTAGRRSAHFHSDETLALYEASLLRWFKRNILTQARHGLFWMLTPTPAEVPNSSLVHMFETASRAFGSAEYFGRLDQDGAWVIDFEKLQRSGAKMDADGIGIPVILCGTAFSFVHLSDWAQERGIALKLPRGSRVIETGGYKGRSRSIAKKELRAMISAVSGIPDEHIITEYGMSELSSQAYATAAGRRFCFPPWARARVISPETGEEVADGEPGLIRVYDLANVGSVMAVQTEDLGIRHGDGLELLGRAAATESRGCSLLPA